MTHRDDSYSQLTLDGRETPHPPPVPRAECPACGKMVTLVPGALMRAHRDGYNGVCVMSGRKRE